MQPSMKAREERPEKEALCSLGLSLARRPRALPPSLLSSLSPFLPSFLVPSPSMCRLFRRRPKIVRMYRLLRRDDMGPRARETPRKRNDAHC